MLFPIIVLAYSLLARHEERQVIVRFGDEYRTYQQGVTSVLWGIRNDDGFYRSLPGL